MMEISKEFRFEAAHSLPHLPGGHKCRNVHGHSYRFEVFVRGDLDERGFVIDYAEIKAAVQPIVDHLDHSYIAPAEDHTGRYLQRQGSAVVWLDRPTTSAEHLALWLWGEIGPKLPGLSRITVYETCTSSVTLTRGQK